MTKFVSELQHLRLPRTVVEFAAQAIVGPVGEACRAALAAEAQLDGYETGAATERNTA